LKVRVEEDSAAEYDKEHMVGIVVAFSLSLSLSLPLSLSLSLFFSAGD
jgi:hypothetical protein